MARQRRIRPVTLLTLLFAATLLASACGPAATQTSATTKTASEEPMTDSATTTEAEPSTDAAAADDPYLWLEEVEGSEAMTWVEARNDESLAVLAADPRFEPMQQQALAILDASDKIPYGARRAEHVYNFWRDEKHVRGLWRRVPRDQYLAEGSSWETLIDLDALAEKEGENWVWDDVSCLEPEYTRCMISLSRGGKDASVRREFDLTTKTFVDDGFTLPEAKSWLDWLDKDTLVVATDVGEGSMTASGYPRTLRVWQRGTPLEEATLVFEAQPDDIAAWPWVHHDPDGTRWLLFDRSITFFTAQYTLASPDDPGSQLTLPLPEDLRPTGFFQGRLLATLRSDWTLGGETFAQGSIVAIELAPYRGFVDGKVLFETPPEPRVELIYQPDDKSAVQAVHTTRDAVLVTLLVDVKPRIERYTLDATSGAWSGAALTLPSEHGTAFVVDASPYETEVFLRHESPIDPQALYALDTAQAGAEATQLATLPARFDAAGMRVEQHRAQSADGTQVPYFVVLPEGWSADATRPTYLYAYGGFEHAMLPYYRALTGRFWLERGGIFVLANIRGGGEYGPRWHQAALKANRQRAFDDFHAVAEDLVTRGYTTHEQLGIHGGSNGGLLMGVAVTQRPELYGAAIIDVPLLDMLRYDKLLAGASWTGEYGDPDVPEERTWLESYSPYQKVVKDKAYPRVLLTTSTADDRVHPGHARKMAARMLEQGHELFYYENTEGGHGGVANNKQQAFVSALKYVYLMRELGLE